MSMFRCPDAALVLAALMFSCSDDSNDMDSSSAGTGGSTGGPAAQEVTFTADVHPILLMKCGSSECHDGSRKPIQPGHAAADVQAAYAATQETGQMGQPVYERILARITSADPGSIMPPPYANPPCQGAIGAPGCITEDELAVIRAWIAAGTPP
jgi:hypothetical protein